jgi:hypothetical protein
MRPDPVPPPKGRRRWQFGLRSLFVVMTIVALTCAWLSTREEREDGPVLPFTTCDNLAKGFGCTLFHITDVARYERCSVLLYRGGKAELILEQELETCGNDICVALPRRSEDAVVALAWKDGYSKVRVDLDWPSGSRAESKRFRRARPVLSLMGTTFGPDPDPSYFTGNRWIFVVKFE